MAILHNSLSVEQAAGLSLDAVLYTEVNEALAEIGSPDTGDSLAIINAAQAWELSVFFSTVARHLAIRQSVINSPWEAQF